MLAGKSPLWCLSYFHGFHADIFLILGSQFVVTSSLFSN